MRRNGDFFFPFFFSFGGTKGKGKKSLVLLLFRRLYVVWMIETERKEEMGDDERKAKTPQKRIEGKRETERGGIVARSSNNQKVDFPGF